MRITANQLTIFRIVSLPVPCILLYGGSTAKLVALFIFALLGFTDYLDGVLARRHGTTPFGTFFDPIADKIFIAVIYIPFVHLGYIPLWTAILLFLREFLITEVRRLMSQKKLELRVTELAKSKTTIQMAGAAFILLAHLIPNRNLIIPLFFLPIVCTVVIGLISLILKKGLSHRILLALFCFSYILLIRLIFNPQWSAFLYMIIILLFTYASGLQYIVVSYSAWAGVYRNPFFLIVRLVSSCVIPILALIMLRFVPSLSWMAIFVISFDFASQGLDTWISSLGREEKVKDRLRQATLIPLAVLAVLLFSLADTRTMAGGILWICLILSTFYMAIDYYGHRKLLLTGTLSRS